MQPTAPAAHAISAMEFLQGTGFAAPLWEVGVLILICSYCLLTGRHKGGLITAYFAIFYWGFVLNRGDLVETLSSTTLGIFLYSAAGVIMVGVAIFSFFIKTKD